MSSHQKGVGSGKGSKGSKCQLRPSLSSFAGSVSLKPDPFLFNGVNYLAHADRALPENIQNSFTFLLEPPPPTERGGLKVASPSLSWMFTGLPLLERPCKILRPTGGPCPQPPAFEVQWQTRTGFNWQSQSATILHQNHLEGLLKQIAGPHLQTF